MWATSATSPILSILIAILSFLSWQFDPEIIMRKDECGGFTPMNELSN
jgi:hypothetical protein